MRQLKILNFLFIFTVGLCEASPQTGLAYKQYNRNEVNIQVLTIDPKMVKVVAVRAQDMGQGLATVEKFATHYSALAAINGGFFRVNSSDASIGLPAGVLKINNHWHGIAYKTRAAIGWDPASNNVLIDRIQTNSQLIIEGITLPIHATNNALNPNKGILFTNSYVEQLDLNGTLAITFKNQKVQNIHTKGNPPINSDTYMYSVPAALQQRLSRTKPGDRVQFQINVIPQLDKSSARMWNKMPYIVGGGPVLIKDHKAVDYKTEKLSNKFATGHYARTAVGILPDKKWVFVVVERSLFNLLEEDTGWTLAQLSEFMQELGCVAAINLDGGHSSTMYVQNKFKKSTEQYSLGNNLGNERMVADALLVLPR